MAFRELTQLANETAARPATAHRGPSSRIGSSPASAAARPAWFGTEARAQLRSIADDLLFFFSPGVLVADAAAFWDLSTVVIQRLLPPKI